MNTVHLVVHIAQHHSLKLPVLCWWHWLALPGLTSDLPNLTVPCQGGFSVAAAHPGVCN